ncbi:MAG TPA: RnfABCDGE type electron transport complex subunit D [Candidatus Limnocylindria bacterium]|nr:RnfABCDGE type electron transport complex subunit D [Candidatus Limnocylindria bacterium]
MREVWSQLLRLPQALLVQTDQLPFDSTYALALLPLIVFSILFFRQDALLLYGLCLLAGIVCLLSIQLARMTVGLPAWVGFKASHPLIASLLIACFLSPVTPPWVAVTLVILLVILDTVVWPQLMRMLVQPALLVFAFLFLVEGQLRIPFVNAFDLRPLDDPLTLWYRFHAMVDPIKMYVGNVPGPMGATSMGAVLLGVVYLWYARKISLSLLLGYYAGLAAGALAYGSDVAFQLSSGPTLYIAGFLAADRRRMVLSDRLSAAIGVFAGGLTMVLRAFGQGPNAAWQSLLVVGLFATLIYQLTSGARFSLPAFRRLRHRPSYPSPSGSTAGRQLRPGRTAPLPVSRQQPVLATGGSTLAASRRYQPAARVHQFDVSAQDDIVRQMRIQAARRSRSRGGNRLVQVLALVVINPIGLWLTWRRSDPAWLKSILTVLSIAWYTGIVGLALLVVRLHGFRI